MLSNIISALQKVVEHTIQAQSFFSTLVLSKEFEVFPIEKELTDFAPKVAFSGVDGGSGVLIDGGHFCVSFMRVACVHPDYTTQKEEYFLVATIDKNIEVVLYGKEMQTYSFDRSLFDMDDFAVQVTNYVRRIKELDMAAKQKSVVLIDGSLQTKNESEVITKNMVGICKTTRVLTDRAISFTHYFSDKGVGCSKELATHKTGWHIYACRFHSKSPFVFRVDSFGIPIDITDDCKDITFLGYPYTLIKADHTARVSKEEIRYHRARIEKQLPDLLRHRLSLFESTIIAHDKLDTAKF